MSRDFHGIGHNREPGKEGDSIIVLLQSIQSIVM